MLEIYKIKLIHLKVYEMINNNENRLLNLYIIYERLKSLSKYKSPKYDKNALKFYIIIFL